MSADSLIVKCGNCGARNRVPKSKAGERPICGRCRNRLSLDHYYPDHPVDVSDSSFGKEVLGFPGPAVVFFWSPSCGYCQKLLPIIDQLSGEYAGKIKFARLLTAQNPTMSSRYNVQGVPTLVFFNSGKEVDRTVGALPKEDLKRHLNMLK